MDHDGMGTIWNHPYYSLFRIPGSMGLVSDGFRERTCREEKVRFSSATLMKIAKMQKKTCGLRAKIV